MNSDAALEHFAPFAWHGASYCTFTLGDTKLAVNVERVHEVIPARAGTPVPGAPPAVRGVINLRGELVTIVDMRDVLGFSVPESTPSRPRILVIRSDDGLVGVGVDLMGDVVYLDVTDFEPPPETMSARLARVITAVCKRPAELVLIVDVDALLQVAAGRADDRST